MCALRFVVEMFVDRRVGWRTHNPFIVNGRSGSQPTPAYSSHVEKWAKVRGDKLALPVPGLFHQELRGRVSRATSCGLTSARAQPTTAASRNRVTVAILCPQNLDYLISFLAPSTPAALRCRCSTGRGKARQSVTRGARPCPVDDPDHHRLRRRVRKFIGPDRPRERPRVIAVDAVQKSPPPGGGPRPTRKPSRTCSTRRVPPATVQITHLNLPTNVVPGAQCPGRTEGDRGSAGSRSSTT